MPFLIIPICLATTFPFHQPQLIVLIWTLSKWVSLMSLVVIIYKNTLICGVERVQIEVIDSKIIKHSCATAYSGW